MRPRQKRYVTASPSGCCKHRVTVGFTGGGGMERCVSRREARQLVRDINKALAGK